MSKENPKTLFMMADIGERNPSESKRKRKRKRETSSTGDSRDFISSMPDEILHHIISFNPTNLAVKTSLLSKRWRRVWCETPCLSFHGPEATARRIDQTLLFYRAMKLTSFRLAIAYYVNSREIDRWIKFAMSHCVQKLSVSFHLNYTCPEFFFLSSSLEKLYVIYALIPRCTTVSWKSLRNLTLSSCNLSYDESFDNILSGCPILETLELIYCLGLPQRLDLSKSLSLKRLEIKLSFQIAYSVEIIAPHIHYLKLTICKVPCTLVDVSSLTEASLEISVSRDFFWLDDFFQIMVLKMLEKLQKVERLTFGRTLLQMLSLAELSGHPFPMLRLQTLIVETMVVRSDIRGITKDPNLDNCWRSEYIQNFPTSEEIYQMMRCESAASKLFASFMELVLRNSKTLETMVVQFRSTSPLALECFAQLLQMPPRLPHNNNVCIVLNPSNYSLVASVSLI